jgi:hypothetical protein
LQQKLQSTRPAQLRQKRLEPSGYKATLSRNAVFASCSIGQWEGQQFVEDEVGFYQ